MIHKFLSDDEFGTTDTYSIVLPIDQGVEHGPANAFLNTEHPEMLDVDYQIDYVNELLNEGLVSATALPYRVATLLVEKYPEQKNNVIVKMNHANNLNPTVTPTQAIFGHSTRKFGGAGFTIYPGSPAQNQMIEQFAEWRYRHDMPVYTKSILWSYPRGGNFDTTSLETTMHAAYIAAQLEPTVIKVKLPAGNYNKAEDVEKIVKSACGIPVLFSGGVKTSRDNVLNDARDIAYGGGLGMIVGRNVFQRRPGEAKELLKEIHAIFTNA